MRLSRRFCLNAPDQRRCPMLMPHRLTTASTPCNAPASNSPPSGSQCSSLVFVGARRTMRNTRWSAVRSAVTQADPIRTEEPAIATVGVTMRALLEPQVALKSAFLEPMSDGGQESSGVGAVDQTVVVSQREQANRPHGDRLVAGVVDAPPGSFTGP